MAVGVGAAWLLLARTVDAASGSLLRRRYERGARRGDATLAVLSSPWHLLVQVLLLVPVLLLPAAVALASAFIPGLFVDRHGRPVGDQRRARGRRARRVPDRVVGHRRRRRCGAASRRLARGTAPGRTGATLAVVLLLALAGGALVLLAMSGAGCPSWEPLTGPPCSLP